MRLFIFVCLVALIAQDDETTRKIWDTAFSNQGNKSAATQKSDKRKYRIVTPEVPVKGVAPDSVIGITLWRLRPARSADKGERIITHEGHEMAQWVPERVSSTGRLAEGDRIRISIEAARSGYLYVVDQEQYSNGSSGEPYLIFPTTRTHSGDNSVRAGRVIEIPSQDDSPPYFTLKRTRTNHIGESVSVFVSPTPIENLAINEKARKLPDEIFSRWEKLWGMPAGRLEMEDGESRPWTKQERAAGADTTRSLKADEPSPQTVYYRPGVDGASPILVKVQLRYSKSR